MKIQGYPKWQRIHKGPPVMVTVLPECQKAWSRTTWLVLLIPTAAKFVLHLLTARGYGIHGDELYYLACSDHLAWGYVDQPPLSLLLLHLQRTVFGDSLLSIRFLPALAGSLIVLLTGLLARRIGAKAFGQLLAELCALIAGVYLSAGHVYSMNVFDLLFWLAAFHLIVRIIDGGPPTLWAWLGIVVGLGFENKVSILFLCLGLAAGLLLTRQRQTLRTPWLLIGIGLAALLILPNIIWQAIHGWPTLEWMANARSMKNVTFSLPAYLAQQVLLMHPLTVVVWLTGIAGLFFHTSMARYRSLGWCYLVVLTAFVIGGGKPYYLSPIYPILFAAGAMVIERRLARNWLRTTMAAVFLAGGVLAAPLAMPLLPVDRLITYSNAIGVSASSDERHPEGKIPDYFANMFGWRKLTALVAGVYNTLPPEDRAACAIFSYNYMQAGAIDYFGRQFHLPRAICSHNNYWLWGTRGYSGDVMIVLGGSAGNLQKHFGEVTERARFWDEYVQPNLNGLRIFVVRKPKASLPSLWPELKEFI